MAIGIGLMLGILAPYGSYQNPGALERIAYWIVSILLGLGVYAVPVMLLRRKLAVWRGVSFWSGVLIATALLSQMQTLMTRDLALSIWPAVAPRLPGWWTWYAQVLALALPAVLSGVWALRRRNGPYPETSAPIEPLQKGESGHGLLPDNASFSDVLRGAAVADGSSPLRIGAAYPRPERVAALQMEDHYIRCHLEQGSCLVHGVFRDAVQRQAGCDGLQVHRSWWVARRAMACWEGTPRSMRLHLHNGLIVPVARAQVTHLREAGWLDNGSEKDMHRAISDGQTPHQNKG